MSSEPFSSLEIADYALIGDCETAALVGRNGSIDWLCVPRFDSGACFAALLGRSEHGRWLLAPAGDLRAVHRRYRGETLILETEFETEHGAVTLVDCMPPRTEQPMLVRMVIGKGGEVRMKMELVIRFDYGSVVPWVRQIDGGIRAIAGPDELDIHTRVPLQGENLTTVADFTVTEGERIPFVLAWRPSNQERQEDLDAEDAIERTEQWWCDWSSRCSHGGEWHEAVTRSLITLKALTYAPTGGVVAAVTTSLPEQLGGIRNWDYRYCWLRDSTFTLYALMSNGYAEEAAAWREWLLRAVAGAPEQLQIMYGLAGERRLTELEIDWLPGYRGCAPVRIGNAAHEQFQLDVFGEVIDTLHLAQKVGLKSDDDAWRVQRSLLDHLESKWTEPDEGIWEVRGARQHFTHSKVMAWVAIDRAVKTVERFGGEGPVEHWRKLRAEIHADVCRRGFDSSLGSFVQYYGSKKLDASLLMIPLVGFLPASDARVRGTIEAIERDLMSYGFINRYDGSSGVDGLPSGEGAFLLCTFWFADNLNAIGRHDEARRLFERLLAIRNDVGLLSEEVLPSTGQLLGNFPQAFSHVALVNTALNLSASKQAATTAPMHARCV